jgi:ferredoxin
MKATVDQTVCIGCGSCEATAPGSFKIDQKIMKAEAITPTGDSDDLVRQAAEGCPVQAIKIEE